MLNQLWYTVQSRLDRLTRFLSAPDPMAELEAECQSLWHSVEMKLNQMYRSDALSGLERDCERARIQLASLRAGLARYRVQIEWTSQEVARQELALSRLEARRRAAIAAGQQAAPTHWIREWQRASEVLASRRAQMARHEGQYQRVLALFREISRQLRQLEQRIRADQADTHLQRIEQQLTGAAEVQLAGAFERGDFEQQIAGMTS